MTRLLYILKCSFACLLACSGVGVTFGQSAESATSLVAGVTQRCVLLKKTDRIMTGNVRAVGKYLEIEIADQSRVSIPQDQIAYIGENLEAVYEFKKRSVSRWAVGDHFQLTRWCIQNGLLDHAVEHYLEVNRQAAQNDSVKRLGAELEQKILADESFRQYVGLAPLHAASAPAPSTTSKAAEQAAVTTASFAGFDGNQAEISLRFTDRIQPILINRCSQAACHGVNASTGWRIVEPIGKSYARISAENLRQVLLQLEQDQNNVPKLIRFATQPHGLQRESGINAVEVGLLDELKRWIRFVENPVTYAVASQNTLASEVAGASLAGAVQPLQPNALNVLTPVAPGASQLRSVPRAAVGSDFPTGETRPSMSEIDALEAQLDRILTNQAAGGASADPFDPAEFNRQTGQAKQP